MADNSISTKKRYLAEEHFVSYIKKRKGMVEYKDVDESNSAKNTSYSYISLNLPSIQPQIVLCVIQISGVPPTSRGGRGRSQGQTPPP